MKTSIQPTVRYAAAVVLGLCLVLGVWASARLIGPDALPVRWVDVTGPFERVSADQVRMAVASAADDGFFAIEPDHIQRRVKAIPWVADAVVTKRWPDTIEVRVMEHVALARFGDDRLISEGGELFQVEGAENIAELPVFHGQQEAAMEMVSFFKGAQSLLDRANLRLNVLHYSRRGAWSAEIGHGIELEFGADRPLSRLERFVEALEQLGPNADDRLVRVDLRYGHGFAVRWRENEGSAQLLEVSTRP